jgi:superfamily II DNA or RNA helicase
MVGRILRIASGKSDAVLLDHVGNVVRHGMPDATREWTLEGRARRSGAPPVRQCMQCYAAFSPAPKCPSCGYLFPIKAAGRRIETKEGNLQQVDEVTVQRMKREQIQSLVRGCAGLNELQELGRRMGYRPSWAWMQWQIRLKRRRAAA